MKMLLVALSTTDCKRQVSNYENYLKKFIEMGHGAYFINKKGKFTYPTIEPYQYLMHYQKYKGRFNSDRDRAIKRVSACKYFIENTSYDYLWITADDVHYDVDALERMLIDFTIKHDTNSDIIFVGHNINWLNSYYLQGGSGSILSRKGAQKFLEYGEKYIEKSSFTDDYNLQFVRKYMNISERESSTHYMFGQGSIVDDVINNKWWVNLTKKCPLPNKLPQNIQTFTGLHNLADLVGWHGKSEVKSRNCITSIIEAKKNDKSIHYYFDGISIGRN